MTESQSKDIECLAEELALAMINADAAARRLKDARVKLSAFLLKIVMADNIASTGVPVNK